MTMRLVPDPALPRAFAGGLLRRLTSADLVAFQAYRRDPELGRYQGWSPMSDPEAAAFLAEMGSAPLFVPGEWIQLGIADPATDRLVGDIGLCLTLDETSVEIGFTLEAAAQGRGVATAAVRAGIALAFEATDAERVVAITDSRNSASIRLLQRVGMRRDEVRHTVFRGEPCVEHVYAVGRKARGLGMRPRSGAHVPR